MTMLLPAPSPFSLSHTLECGQAFRWQRRKGWYCGVLSGAIVKLRQRGDALEVASSPTREADLATLLEHYLGFEDDLPAIYRRICRDKVVAEAVSRFRGLRLLRQDPWECLISYLCSINSNIPRISALVEALSQRFGAPLATGRHKRGDFPTPEALADASLADLREVGLGFRVPYIAGAASKLAEGALDMAALRDMPYEYAKASLMALPGVGEKVADCVLLFSLGMGEAFPVDRWVGRALEEWYASALSRPPGRKTLSYKAVSQWARWHFGRDAGYAQQYLFYSMRSQHQRPIS